MRDVLDLGQVAPGEPDERRVGVRGVQHLANLLRGDTRLQPRVDRFENAAIERNEMRHERDRDPQLLLDLGRVPVSEHAIRRHAAVTLGEVRPLARRLARTRHARLRVDDHARFDHPRGHQRTHGEDRRRRVAARTGHERRVFQFLAVVLREPVGERRLHLGRRVRVPLLPRGIVTQPERTREIEDAAAAARQGRTDLGGSGIRQREKNGVGLGRERVEIERHDWLIPDPGERRQAPGF